MKKVLQEIADERARQDAKWGEQNHPIITENLLREMYEAEAKICKLMYTQLSKQNKLTWEVILSEEIAEALSETDPLKIRAELVQVAAVVVAMIESLDRNELKDTHAPEEKGRE